METVAIGDVWEDVDRRRRGRQFEVIRIVGGKAVCNPVKVGPTKGKTPVRIRLDRFVDKYYKKVKTGNGSPQQSIFFTKRDNSVSNTSFIDRCNALMPGNWCKVQASHAKLVSGQFTIYVRELSRHACDVKLICSDQWLLSTIVYDDLDAALQVVRDRMEMLVDDLCSVLT